ncbi:MAG: ABC transporter permease, partial [Pseudomonadota bacterium]
MKRAINYVPDRPAGFFLALLPFILVFGIYLVGSDARLTANPAVKMMPSLSHFGVAMLRMSFEENR